MAVMAYKFKIESYKFQKPVVNIKGKYLVDHELGQNWPVVYLLHGNKEIYVGETTSANTRMEQHLNPNGDKYEKRRKLETVEIIFDKEFNKSAILDIEQELIRLFDYDIKRAKKKSKYFKELQNDNNGQSKFHNYYHRARYQQEVEFIWDKLRKQKLATNEYHEIVNDVLFKFSPYTNLNEEQKTVSYKIINDMMDVLEKRAQGENVDYTAIVKGAAGTGKTILLLFMFRCIKDALTRNQTDFIEEDEDEISPDEAVELNEYSKLLNRIKLYVRQYGVPKIAYIAQMTSLRNTIKTVLKQFDRSWGTDAIGPKDLVNICTASPGTIDQYDIVFVDETHRLCQRHSISWMGTFDEACRKLYGDSVDCNSKTALDWIVSCSKCRVLVYDDVQTVKESDILPSQFANALKGHPYKKNIYILKQQMRCRVEMDYISYLSDIFNCRPDLQKYDVQEYDFKLYSDANRLIADIARHHKNVGLSKVTAGYGWQWRKKKYDRLHKECNELKISDRAKRVKYYASHLKSEDDGLIIFGDHKYVRNMDFDWLIKGEPTEIGCIHTSQGYDLNYVGVLFGPEIDYQDGQIVVYPDKVKDGCINTNLKGLSEDEKADKVKNISNYILNAYKVMMERGIRGCYVYAYNDSLRDYLSRFIDKADK